MPAFETVTSGGTPMNMIVARPAGAGPHPAIAVMCHIEGLDDFTRDRCERLAAEGFVAIAPDIFHRHPWDDDRNARRATLADDAMVEDIETAVAYAVDKAGADRGRLGILGHCLGGRTALLGAGSVADFRACAMYYGGRTMNAWGEGPSPFERIGNIKGPVIGFFGNLDQGPSPEDVNKIEAEMIRCGVPVEFHRYDGAGHAFQDFTTARHHPAAAEDSWARTLAFFKRTIGA